MLIRQTFLYLPAQLLGPAMQFVAAIVWTHYLSPEAYGVLMFLMVAQELVFVLCLSWWSHYTLRFFGTLETTEQREHYRRVEGVVFLVSAGLQIIALGVVLIFLSADVTPLLVLTSMCYTIARSISNHLGERARAGGHILAYTIAATAGPLGGFLLAFLLVVKVHASPDIAMTGFALAQLAALLWLFVAMRVTLLRVTFDRVLLGQALRFGLPLMAGGVVGWISMNGIRAIVDYQKGVEAVGLISVGWGLGQRLSATVAMLVTAAAFPLAVKKFHNESEAEGLKQLSLSGALLYSLMAPACAGLLLVGPLVTELFIAVPFQPVTLVVLPLAVLAGAVRNMRLHFADQVLLLFERTKTSLALNVFESLAVIAGCFIGLSFSLEYAALGCLIGSLIAAIVGFVMASVTFKLPMPWLHALKISLATAAMSFGIWFVPWAKILGDSAARLAAEILTGATIYALALVLLYARDIQNFVRARKHTSSGV